MAIEVLNSQNLIENNNIDSLKQNIECSDLVVLTRPKYSFFKTD